MENSVRGKLLHGVAWKFTERIFVKGLQFLIGIILARLLSPSDFGVIGMLTIFISISDAFIDGGFTKALIQRQTCKEIDFSTAFVTNVGVSIIIYFFLFIGAPWIAVFYKEPILTDLTRVLALNFILGSFNVVQRSKLMAKVDFKSLTIINLLSTIVSGIVGISMAYLDYGVWSLVGQAISASLVLMIVFPFFSKWKPSIKFSKESFKNLFGFGSKLMLTGVVSEIVNNISTICIGRYYKSAQLGFFTRASQFPLMISGTLTDVLGTVTFPVLSELQNDHNHMVSVYRKTLFITAMSVFPIMTLCVLLARPMVIVLLTEKWLPCVVLMQWLFLARMFTPLSSLNMNILNAVGRSDLFMKLDFSKIPLDIIVLAITIPLGVEAITIGSFCLSFICFFINAYLPGRMFGYGALQQLSDWRYIILSILIMAAVVYGFLRLVSNEWVQLFVGGLVGVIVYLLCCFLFRVINCDMLKMIKIKK